MKTSYYSVMDSGVGPLTLRWAGEALAGVYFDNAPILRQRHRSEDGAWVRDDGCSPLRTVREQLEEYFRGERTDFDVPLALEGTPFQVEVWQALREIPFGKTASYAELARRVGRAAWPGPRAVGAANGQNPIVVIVPCHRVIGADGALVGFGGGLSKKSWLLTHEGASFVPPRPKQMELPLG
jgi:methylated-DNA-[protein]-cysteine S-methyltransferase